MMKKIIAAVVAIFAMLAVASPAQASTVTWTEKDRAFVRIVRAEAPWFKYARVSDMVKSARLTCETLDTGYDETSAAWDMVDVGFTKKQAIVFVATAITVYCPRHGGDNIRSNDAAKSAGDISLALLLAKAAWSALDYSDQENICEGWYTMRTWTRNEMAKSIRQVYNEDMGYISVYDSRRVAYRLLNWAC
jgi:hypothetical protein